MWTLQSKIGHTTSRHPLCPDCGYDLVATVEANGRVCPECGLRFEAGDLQLEPRPGDWTPWLGIRRGVRALAIRSVPIMPLWTLFVWVGSAYVTTTGIRVYYLLSLASLLFGYLFARNIVEKFGCVSVVVTAITSLYVVAVFGVGVAIATALRPMPAEAAAMCVLVPGLIATAIIVKVTLLDD